MTLPFLKCILAHPCWIGARLMPTFLLYTHITFLFLLLFLFFLLTFLLYDIFRRDVVAMFLIYSKYLFQYR